MNDVQASDTCALAGARQGVRRLLVGTMLNALQPTINCTKMKYSTVSFQHSAFAEGLISWNKARIFFWPDHGGFDW
jgi:hypothetical protein